MSKGKVKYFNQSKGWGIIAGEDVAQDVYVHHTSIDMEGFKTLREGQEVQFQLTTTDKGLRAEHVTLTP